MKVHAVRGFGITVEGVAEDRGTDPALVRWRGGMDAELVGSSGLGTEFDPGRSVISGDHAPEGSGGTSLPRTDDLSGAMIPVHAQGQFDDTLLLLEGSIQDRFVGLPDLALLKLARESSEHPLGHRDHHETAGFDVESMGHDAAVGPGKRLGDARLDRVLSV